MPLDNFSIYFQNQYFPKFLSNQSFFTTKNSQTIILGFGNLKNKKKKPRKVKFKKFFCKFFFSEILYTIHYLWSITNSKIWLLNSNLAKIWIINVNSIILQLGWGGPAGSDILIYSPPSRTCSRRTRTFIKK